MEFLPFPPPDPLQVWGLLSRGLGLVFLVSFASLWSQVLPTAGRDGVMPVTNLLRRAAADFPGLARFLYFPTLLWVSASDRALRLLLVVGVASAAAVIHGGPHVPLALGACYVVYLSLDRAVGLVFPWDCLLFEAGFLGLLLPATLPLPDIAAVAAPLPALSWAYRILLVRLMVGFGKFKFIGATRDDWTYLTGFLIAQPLVSPVGWYLHKAPVLLLKLAMLGMFIAEIPVPLLLLHPGEFGVLAGIIIALLMFGIWLGGNFGFFNLLVIVLCIVALDVETPRQLSVQQLLDPAHALTHGLLALHLAGGLAAFPLNSFCGQSWLHWPVFLRLPAPLRAIVSLFRLLHPLRFFHPFGVFPPKVLPAVKCIPIVEATWDQESWRELPHRFSPTTELSPPRFIAPHHPRGDQSVVYETFGLNDTSMFHNIVGGGTPYSFTKLSGAHALMQRIMEGRGKAYGTVFFAAGALPDEPPTAMRITTYMLEPTTHAERVETGRWWSRSYVGPHLPVQRARPTFWQDVLPSPELWHWEDVVWKRRSVLSQLVARVAKGESPHAVATARLGSGLDEQLTDADVALFWEDFVPRIAKLDRSSWASLPDAVDALRVDHGDRQILRLERVLGRLSFILSSKLDPIFFGQGIGALLGARRSALGAGVKSYLHLGMLAHEVILAGREAFDVVMVDPGSASSYGRDLDMARGMYLTAIFRYEVFIFEAQKARLLHAVLESGRKSQFSLEDEQLAARLDAIAQRAWGAVDFAPFIREQFRGERFEAGMPERSPTFHFDERGVLTRDG